MVSSAERSNEKGGHAGDRQQFDAGSRAFGAHVAQGGVAEHDVGGHGDFGGDFRAQGFQFVEERVVGARMMSVLPMTPTGSPCSGTGGVCAAGACVLG